MDLKHLQPRRESDAPIYMQLYRRFRDAIAAGKLRPGDRVPSVRSLASELHLARGTVELAYQMLTSEGYFEARGPAGTVVSPRLNSVGEAGRAALSKPPSKPAQRPQAASDEPMPFQFGLPALDAFPRKTWTRLAGRSLRVLGAAAMNYPDPAGHEPLRRAIATYLGISRGIACSYEQVFITAGYRGALELICRTVLHSGDVGWHEDPGYLYIRDFLQRSGMRLAPIPVDEEGLNVEIGRRRAADARFAVVTPTHQCPTGVALSLPRRLELLKWAQQRRAWIIEDDYDSEFRYHGRPLPALKSLDRDERVLYTSTFSKVLFPGLRLGYLVAPEAHIGRFRSAANHLSGPGSVWPQATVAEFMAQGHFTRHLRKMRSLYAQRRDYLVDALAQVFGAGLHIAATQAGGTHVLGMLHGRRSDRDFAAAAQSRGLAIQALSHWRMRRSGPEGVLMGFANIPGAEEAVALTRRLMEATRAA
ncbi:PLP-dependent aminotransferase family protein [Castellaniella sp. GW247-6E4]|uniref:MocR-like pyridoxine biosynthesis transcription factor PdxR n=1 Tax=Castellaniella sp. GW247-6E4 TaxID=3140380 RepID=UPI0033144F43